MKYQTNKFNSIYELLLAESALFEDAKDEAEKDAIETVLTNFKTLADYQKEYHNARLEFYNEVKKKQDATPTLKKLAGVDPEIQKIANGTKDELPENLKNLLDYFTTKVGSGGATTTSGGASTTSASTTSASTTSASTTAASTTAASTTARP